MPALLSLSIVEINKIINPGTWEVIHYSRLVGTFYQKQSPFTHSEQNNFFKNRKPGLQQAKNSQHYKGRELRRSANPYSAEFTVPAHIAVRNVLSSSSIADTALHTLNRQKSELLVVS